MSVRIRPSSRLRFGTYLLLDGIQEWDTLFLPTIVPQSDDVNYMVQDGDRIDSIAYTYYKDPALWWVIAAANGMEDLPTDLDAGSVIRIPSPRYVQQELLLNAPNS
jgi:phage tail protein X